MSTKQIQDSQTGEIISLISVTDWYDGNGMTDANCDDIIYFKGEIGDPDPYYMRYIEDHINVKWFGAKGNGITDDTASIQHAFNYLFEVRDKRGSLNSSINLCCFIPDGKYKISSTLLFPKSCTLKGASTNGTILFTIENNIAVLFPAEKPNPLNNHYIPNDPYTNIGEEFTNISNLTIAGPYYGVNPFGWRPNIPNNFSNGILIQNTDKINIQNVHIEGFETAGIFSHNGYYINIFNSVLYNNRVGLFADATSTTINAENTLIRINSIGVILLNSFACNFVNTVIESNGAHYLELVDDNRAPDNSRWVGIVIKNCHNINFSGCYFENHAISSVLDSSHGNTFTNCYFCPLIPPPTPEIDPGFLSHLVWFTGNGSSNNKFTNNYYTTSNEVSYPSCKFLTQDRSTSKGNVFELSTKEQFDHFITQNELEFNEFRNLGLAENAPKLICTGANEQYINAERRNMIYNTFGLTSERPTINLYKGQYYFDSNLGIPIFWQGVNWRKPDGSVA